MSEGPVNFGKPLLFLVIIGCAGGGYYAYSHWPAHYEGTGWEVDFPHAWAAQPFNDPTSPGKIIANGPLLEESHGQGVAWASITYHGTIAWPDFVHKNVPATIDKFEDSEIAHKRALIFEYEDKDVRYMGSAVQRGDAVIICAIGCNKIFFAQNKPLFEKCVKSVRCNR